MLAAADYGQTQNPWLCVAFFVVLIVCVAILPVIIASRQARS